MSKTISLLFLFFFGMGMAQSRLDSHNFKFKGYSLSINDEITDTEGNHILIGSCQATENNAKDRDPKLDAIYKLSDYATDNDRKGLIIITDSEYKIIKLDGLRSPLNKILWDNYNKCYWIGGSTGYTHKEFNYQVSLTKLNLQKEIVGFTAIETESNTYFQDMVMQDKNLVFLTMKTKGEIGKYEYIPELIEISTTDFHDSKNFVFPKKVPNIIHQTETDYPKMYRFDYSPLFVRNGYVCFGLGHSVDKEYGVHFFRYKDGKAEYINEFSNISAYHSPYLIGFLPSGESGYLLAYAAYFSKKATIARTDAFLQALSEKPSKLAAYPDFNKLLELPNGKLAILSVGNFDNWNYLIYDKEGNLQKEIDTGIAKRFYPSLFKIVKDNTILCSFYMPNKPETSVLQELDID